MRKFPRSGIRPTSDKVREAVFNILGNRLEGKTVLDLFAGSGAMGIEALSRGAEFAVFMDDSPEAVALLRSNLSVCGIEKSAKIIRWNILRNLDALRTLHRTFDVVFLDPPYALQCIAQTLDRLGSSNRIAVDARIVAEHDDSEAIPVRLGGFCLQDQRRYGKTLVSIFKHMI